MPKFSDKSKGLLSGCDQRLQEICCRAIEVMDFAVITGYRNEAEQNRAVAEGHSKLKYPHGKHNKYPSMAVDLAPYRNGIDWNDNDAFILLGGIMLGIAATRGVKLRWGGDWNGNFNLHEGDSWDKGHFEIVD